jgi:hypothetical protein
MDEEVVRLRRAEGRENRGRSRTSRVIPFGERGPMHAVRETEALVLALTQDACPVAVLLHAFSEIRLCCQQCQQRCL